MPYLAMADADKVLEYVFSPAKLRFVRGASSLQSDAVRGIVREIRRRPLYANGGVLLMRLDEDKLAQDFHCIAEAVFREVTGSATVTTAVVPVNDHDLGEGQFPRTWKRVRDEVEAAKRHRHDVVARGQHWLWAACEVCGTHPASHFWKDPSGAATSICGSCRKKDAKSAKTRMRLAGYVMPKEFTEFGLRSKPQNYLAMVYLDLDRLGDYLATHMRTPGDCSRLSRQLDLAVRQSVRQGILAVSKDGELEGHAGAVELLAGGDDAIVMTNAQHAIPFLREFQEQFQQPYRWQKYPLPSFSAGVVFAHSHFPISDFLSHAKACLRLAKRRKDSNSVAFQVISGPMGGLMREETPWSGNPYAVDDLLELAAGIRELRQADAPTSKIQSFYDLGWKGESQATLEYCDALLRMSEAHRATVRRLIGPTPWQQRPSGAYSRTADLAELWEFVR